MADNSIKKYLQVSAVLLTISLALIYTDYLLIFGNINTSSFTANFIQSIFNGNTIDSKLLSGTSLKGSSIDSLEKTNRLFTEYLELPDGILANKYSIGATSIIISELKDRDVIAIAKSLSAQISEQYNLNKINESTFYLNQLPAETKTHNFLTIVVNNVLYGFQYQPIEHKKVLEIIDALQENE